MNLLLNAQIIYSEQKIHTEDKPDITLHHPHSSSNKYQKVKFSLSEQMIDPQSEKIKIGTSIMNILLSTQFLLSEQIICALRKRFMLRAQIVCSEQKILFRPFHT